MGNKERVVKEGGFKNPRQLLFGLKMQSNVKLVLCC